MSELKTAEFLADVVPISATEAKNNFAGVLDKVMAGGRVVITKHEQARAVLMSVEDYETLVGKQVDPLRVLREEFDGLIQRMQTEKAKRAGHDLFAATPARLGKAAVASARKRG